MKRKCSYPFFSWLLLVLFTYNIVGSYATFFAWRIWMQEQLEELASTLPNNQLILITLLSTEETEQEICINGSMYDVVKTTVENGKTNCYCIRDFEEETLASTITDGAFSKAHNDLAKAIKSLQKKHSEKYTDAFQFHFISHQIVLPKTIYYHNKKYMECIITKNSPPPKG